MSEPTMVVDAGNTCFSQREAEQCGWKIWKGHWAYHGTLRMYRRHAEKTIYGPDNDWYPTRWTLEVDGRTLQEADERILQAITSFESKYNQILTTP